MSNISPLAIIEEGAKIGLNVSIGPYCFVSKDAEIGDNTTLAQGAQILGNTKIGEGNEIFSYAVLGSKPQDLKYRGEEVELIIGNRNIIREFTLFNPGTAGGGGKTVIGDNNLFMGYVHIAHDCHIGNNTILANAVTLAGHVKIDDHAVIGGLTPIHQFVKIGEHSMIGGASAVAQDVPPYCLVEGNRASIRGLNLTGLRRKLDRADIDALKRAYSKLFKNKNGKHLMENAKAILEFEENRYVIKLLEFILNNTRGIPFRRDKISDKNDDEEN
jgi:UDP-N-acetylglucosamine acyltransferase